MAKEKKVVVEGEEGKEVKTRTQIALDKLNKDFGSGTVVRMGDSPDSTRKLDVISTGSLKLDLATGVMGVPLGRIIEVYGWESSGKTTLIEHIIAEAQKTYTDKKAGLVDAEHAFDPIYATAIGVDIDNLYLSQPMYGEEGLAVVEALTETGEFSVIVVDSVAALTPRKEIEGEMGDSTIGLQSRMMGQAMRKLAAIAQKNNTCLIFINQLREKIGVMFGSPETTSGGNALRFYSSMRIDVRKSLDLVNGLNTTKFKIVKNKVAKPYGTAKVDVIWGLGFDKTKDLIDLAVEMGIVVKSGSWFSYDNNQLGQGIDGITSLFLSNPEFAKEITEKVKQKITDGYESPRELPKEK